LNRAQQLQYEVRFEVNGKEGDSVGLDLTSKNDIFYAQLFQGLQKGSVLFFSNVSPPGYLHGQFGQCFTRTFQKDKLSGNIAERR
jgi:hypothetical protein